MYTHLHAYWGVYSWLKLADGMCFYLKVSTRRYCPWLHFHLSLRCIILVASRQLHVCDFESCRIYYCKSNGANVQSPSWHHPPWISKTQDKHLMRGQQPKFQRLPHALFEPCWICSNFWTSGFRIRNRIVDDVPDWSCYSCLCNLDVSLIGSGRFKFR